MWRSRWLQRYEHATEEAASLASEALSDVMHLLGPEGYDCKIHMYEAREDEVLMVQFWRYEADDTELPCLAVALTVSRVEPPVAYVNVHLEEQGLACLDKIPQHGWMKSQPGFRMEIRELQEDVLDWVTQQLKMAPLQRVF